MFPVTQSGMAMLGIKPDGMGGFVFSVGNVFIELPTQDDALQLYGVLSGEQQCGEFRRDRDGVRVGSVVVKITGYQLVRLKTRLEKLLTEGGE